MKSILFLVPKMNGPYGNFIYNTSWPEQINDAIEKNKWKVITPSVLLLASIAKDEKYEVDVIDEEFRQVNENIKYDIVCIYTVTPNVKRAYWYAQKFRESGAWIVIGGVHSYFMHKESVKYCNTLMIGEGEYIFCEFLHDYQKGKAKSRYNQEKSKVELIHSPIPLYSILNKKEQMLVPMQTARGCSHNCRFCNVKSLYGNTFRAKIIMQIRQELDEIGKLPHTKKIYVTDDNIYSQLNHINTLINAFKNSKFTWYANTDISFADQEENIRSAYKSGLRQVLIGFESVISTLYQLDKDNFKYRYLNRYKEYINKIQSNGIGVVGSFIVGQENDDEDTFKYLIEFIYETKLYGASVTVSTPYPGTYLFYKKKKENKIFTYDWDYYTIFQPVMKTQKLTTDRLNELYTQLIMTINSKQFIDNKLKYFSNIYRSL